MLPIIFLLSVALLDPQAAVAQVRPLVTVCWGPNASALEQAAARELGGYLGKIYPRNEFLAQAQLPPAGQCILVGCVTNWPELTVLVADRGPVVPESFVVTTGQNEARELGVIAGADPRGTVYGVYALLDKLGAGFYLSYDALTSAKPEPFSFAGWNFADAPLTGVRLVFNWHNFLSGCSTWNAPEWKSWTLQAQKMGYNAIMVHAYGNNPMAEFSFQGQAKPVGYLSSTRLGRDWSTQHANDVRRFYGGFVFDSPVFGADASQATEGNRGPGAQQLMREVFAYAGERGMDVYFAVDVDTVSANPPALVKLLPESARFPIQVKGIAWMNQGEDTLWLANPDTPEGYQYYKAQVADYLRVYPQITTLVVWFRRDATPWMGLKVEEMPTPWREQYQAELEKTPEAGQMRHAHNLFALGKIAAAFRRALNEIGRPDVKLATGSWAFDFIEPADRFMPAEVALIPLDYNVLHDRSQMDTAERRQFVRNVAAHRPVIPVVWAHHDDGNYVGRPYTPYPEFATKLADANDAGFGIIHWTTRPLDLYFASLIKQLWRATKDLPLDQFCRDMAARCFGESARESGGAYLLRWATEAPKIARETSDYFVDKPLPDPASLLPGYEARLRLLSEAGQTPLDPPGRDRVKYYEGLERYLLEVHRTEATLRQSRELLQAGDLAGARRAFENCRPETVIEDYARFSSLGGITRGEQGLVVSMNLRWLTHYLRHRQLLGVAPVRYCFGPTSHDPLAQSPGAWTFYIDPGTNFWERLGERETGATVFTVPEDQAVDSGPDLMMLGRELGRSGIESDKPVRLAVQPILAKGGRGRASGGVLPAGRYRLHLYFLDPTSATAGQRVFEVNIGRDSAFEWLRFPPIKARYLRLLCQGNSANDWNSLWEVRLATLAHDGAGPKVTASAALPDYPAAHAADGHSNTRWAVQGQDVWLRFELDPDRETDRLGLAWFEAGKRAARFDLQYSEDGMRWTNVKAERVADALTGTRESVDVFALAGSQRTVVKRSYEVELESAGILQVELTPVTGRALISALELEPVR